MPISSNTLFHFTDSLHNLISILTLEFRPRYCLEDFSSIFSAPFKIEEIAVPMVCFCDLLLSQTKEHIKFYGGYGIGMKKKWGVKKGLNPVIYLCQKSCLANQFGSLKTDAAISRDPKIGRFLFEIASRAKKYNGKVFRHGKYINKRCYDEREWRYVPEKMDFSNFALEKKDFLDSDILSKRNRGLSKTFKLSFEPDDIKYIIVQKERQILGMINAVEHIKGDKYDSNTVKKLSSRIITSKQISEDF